MERLTKLQNEREGLVMLSTLAPSSAPWPEEKLRLVDVGGAGGLQAKWINVADRVVPILFEPNPAEAASLRSKIAAQFGGGSVLETGLSNTVGTRGLNIAAYWGCTSLRQPNPDILSGYRIGPAFNIIRTEPVACTRYDVLYHDGLAPAPDAIKIDVQGYEYKVLQGFGGLLQNCLGIELETHVYPIYRDQKLLHHIIAFLADFSFVLRRLHPVPSFDGNVVELDAWFTKDIQTWRTLGPVEKAKFSLICETWDLVGYHRIDPHAPHTQIAPPDLEGRVWHLAKTRGPGP